MNIALVIVFIGAIIFLAHFFEEFFKRTRIPDVLILFILGLIAGPLTSLIKPEHFGLIGYVFTTVTLVFILFEGSMGLCVDSIKSSWKGTLNVSLTNFFATMLVSGVLFFAFSPLGLMASLMLGAIIGGTSSIVVIPLVNQLRMSKSSRSILILESAFTDLLCIMFALAFLEGLKFGTFNPGAMFGKIVSSFIMGALFGIAGALTWSILLNKVRTIKNSLFMTPAFVFIIYGLAELLGYSGAISSLTFGFALANINLFSFKLIDKYITHKRITLNSEEKAFQSEIVFLLKTFFFIFMGISIHLSNIIWMLTGLFITIILFVVRILVVRYSAPRSTSRNDALLMAAIVPKGLAAAVLASIPLQQGLKGGEFIQSVVFSVILFSILITSLLIFLLDKLPAVSNLYNRFMKHFPEETDAETHDEASIGNDKNGHCNDLQHN